MSGFFSKLGSFVQTHTAAAVVIGAVILLALFIWGVMVTARRYR